MQSLRKYLDAFLQSSFGNYGKEGILLGMVTGHFLNMKYTCERTASQLVRALHPQWAHISKSWVGSLMIMQ